MGNKIVQHIQIRFRDTDAMGHVNNAVYFTYFEIARGWLFKDLFGWDKMKELKDLPVIAASNSCNYRRPLFIGTNISAECYVSKIGTRSFTITTKIVGDDKTVYADGKSVVVFYDYKNNRSMEISKHHREVLERFFINDE
ncbi:MAG: acyl-CoA thioesterase [Epsilonproteobacteria bacterium]|nr:acyl-CoA thioesterase [Campylobacterota bacterium]